MQVSNPFFDRQTEETKTATSTTEIDKTTKTNHMKEIENN